MSHSDTSEAKSTGKIKAGKDSLRAARVWLNLDQEVIAAAAGIARASLSQIETGKVIPHESTRGAIQHALEVRGIVFTNGDRPGFYFDKTKVIIPR